MLNPRNALHHEEVDGANYRSFPRRSIMDGLPFLEFRTKLEELGTPLLLQGPMQVSDHQILRDVLPVVGDSLYEYLMRMESRVEFLVSAYRFEKPWQKIIEAAADFPIPLRTLDLSSDPDSYLWLIEFMVIGAANGLLRPYRDQTLDFLVDAMDEVEALDELLSIVGRYDFYVVREKILDLKTTTSTLFGARALLSSVALEDERLLEILLSRGVPLDEFRSDANGLGKVCAIHLAAEQQNEKIIRRLLKAGIDQDGYTEREPLSHLLNLFSIKKDPRVVQISQAVVNVILDWRSNTHTSHECGVYWASLFVEAWVLDATQFLDALFNYRQASGMDLDFLNPTSFSLRTRKETFSDIAHKLLTDVSLLQVNLWATAEQFWW